jgi:hypothetical protein
VQIEVPRDTDASFSPQIVRKGQRRLTGVDDIVLSLTAKGLTTGEIPAHFDDVYGARSSSFAIHIDGRGYELDLSDGNAARLRDALAPFVAAARRSGGGRGRRAGGGSSTPPRSTDDRGKNAAIREWAVQHGHKISARGRIPASVLEAFRNEVG